MKVPLEQAMHTCHPFVKKVVLIGDKSKIQSCRISLHKRSVMPPISRCVNCN